MASHPSGIPLTLVLLFLAYRILNALLVETFHVPDEYWQSLEVAHRAVFGYGFLTWEWQPSATLRSFLHPGLFALLYQFVQWTSLDAIWPSSVVILPKLLQALLAALGDVCLYLFVSRNYGKSNAVWYMMVNFTNWFLLHNLTRTLANSIETTLFSIFLCYWPVYPGRQHAADNQESHNRMRGRRRVALICAAVCFLLRPTSAITWAFFALLHLYQTKHRLEFLLEASGISVIILAIGTAIDTFYYGRLVSPLVSFVQFNFLTSGAAHYGSHPWHWYLSNGLPMLLGPYLVPLLFSIGKATTFHNPLSWLVAVNVFFFSLIGHKEARFLMPLIPVLNIFIASTISHWWNAGSRSTTASSQAHNHKNDHQQQQSTLRHASQKPHSTEKAESAGINNRLKSAFVLLLIISSLGMAFYTCHVHQRGTLDLTAWLREHEKVTDLLLLMPCHHTPGLAYIHRPNFHLEYLDCSPGLPSGQLDEADVFFENPVLFLQERYSLTQFDPVSFTGSIQGETPYTLKTFVKNPFYEKDSGQHYSTISSPYIRRPLPSHLAMYNVLAVDTNVQRWLQSNRYEEEASFFHAQAADGRVGTHVLLFRRNSS